MLILYRRPDQPQADKLEFSRLRRAGTTRLFVFFQKFPSFSTLKEFFSNSGFFSCWYPFRVDQFERCVWLCGLFVSIIVILKSLLKICCKAHICKIFIFAFDSINNKQINSHIVKIKK